MYKNVFMGFRMRDANEYLDDTEKADRFDEFGLEAVTNAVGHCS
jgi:hypothetical protein